MLFNLICYAVFLFAVIPALAGPMEDTFGAAARNKALGGAGVSIAEDYSATFYNPSLLALCRGSRLSVGYDFVHTDLNANPAALQLGNYNSMSMGFCLKPLNQVGLGVYSNFSMGPIEFTANTLSAEPTFIMYAGDLKAFSMMMGAGYAPFKQLSFGASMSMATSVTLGSDLVILPGQTPWIVAKFPAQISPIVGVILGVTGVPLPDWKLGLVYRSATYGQVNIDVTAKLSKFSQGADALIKGFLSYSPHQIALGSSYFFSDKWLLNGDLTYYFWSKYPGPFLEIATSAESVLPGITVAGVEPPNFSDILVPRVGVEYTVWDKLKLRLGYSFRPTPVPPPIAQAQLLDASTHRVSTGIGYEFQLYQNVFLISDIFASVDILQNARGSAINTGLVVGAEYD